jgi:hypothetical protein
VRRHLESCGGYDVRRSGELVAVRGFPDARCSNDGVRFGFARPTAGLAEPFRGGGYPTARLFCGLCRNKRSMQNCLTRRAVLKTRCYTAVCL